MNTDPKVVFKILAQTPWVCSMNHTCIWQGDNDRCTHGMGRTLVCMAHTRTQIFYLTIGFGGLQNTIKVIRPREPKFHPNHGVGRPHLIRSQLIFKVYRLLMDDIFIYSIFTRHQPPPPKILNSLRWHREQM